jgi:hypothetical protein
MRYNSELKPKLTSSRPAIAKPLCNKKKRLEKEVDQSNFDYKKQLFHPKI